MSWLRIDDLFTSHPKLSGWPPAKRWAWLEVMTYCSRYQTEGVIPADLSLMPRTTTPRLLEEACKAGLLDVDKHGRFVVHDWAEYNPKDPTKADRQARWRRKRDGDVDGRVDAHVDGRVDTTRDGDVDDPTVYGDGPSRAGARARPVPSPKDQDPSFLPAVAKDPERAPEEKAGRRNLLDEDRVHPFDLIPARPEF